MKGFGVVAGLGSLAIATGVLHGVKQAPALAPLTDLELAGIRGGDGPGGTPPKFCTGSPASCTVTPCTAAGNNCTSCAAGPVSSVCQGTAGTPCTATGAHNCPDGNLGICSNTLVCVLGVQTVGCGVYYTCP